jgi:hypothetical protein
MSRNLLSTLCFILTFGYGLTTLLTTSPTDLVGVLSLALRVLVFTSIYLGVGWFLIWLDHTYYPHRHQPP